MYKFHRLATDVTGGVAFVFLVGRQASLHGDNIGRRVHILFGVDAVGAIFVTGIISGRAEEKLNRKREKRGFFLSTTQRRTGEIFVTRRTILPERQMQFRPRFRANSFPFPISCIPFHPSTDPSCCGQSSTLFRCRHRFPIPRWRRCGWSIPSDLQERQRVRHDVFSA